MADSTETIRRITIQGTTQGVNEATAALNKLADAQGNVAVVSDTTAKRALSAQAAYDKQTLSVVAGAREQANYEKAVKTAKAALDQGVISNADYAARVDLLKDKFGQAGLGAKAFAAATSGVSGQLIALSAGAGPVGVFLSALGPWGVAAAVGLGAAEKAFSAMSDAAHDLAQKARELKDFSEATGLTTDQVQALRSEASKFGVDSDKAQSAIQNFTARFNELRVGQGELLTQMRRLNPALADQMAGATDAASALTMFGKALQQTDNIFERNALVKAATGRGGISSAQFLSGLDVNKVTQSYVDAGKALDDNLIKKLAQLDIDVQKTSSKARENIASIFAQPVLEAQLNFNKNMLALSEIAKSFTISPALQALLSIGAKGLLAAIPGFGLLGNAVGAATKDYSKPSTIPDIDPFGTFSAGGAYTQPDPKKDPRYIANQLKDQISAMGDAATAAQKLDLAQKQLAISGKDAGLSTDQLNRSYALLQQTFDNSRLQAMVGALGSAATVSEQLAAKISNLNLQLAKGDIDGATFMRAMAGLHDDEALRKLQDTVSALGNAATESDQYALRVAQLQQQLNQGRISQETFNVAVVAAVPAFGQLKSALDGALNTFISNLAQGKSGMDALVAVAGQLGGAMTSIGTKSLTDSLSKGLAGGGFSFDPVSLGIGAVGMALQFWQGAEQKRKAAEEKQQQAWTAWIAAAEQLRVFIASSNGNAPGSVQTAIVGNTQQGEQLKTLREAALGPAAAGFDQTLKDIDDAEKAFAQRTVDEFKQSFGQTIDLLNEGFGPSSDFGSALAAIKSTGDQLKDTIANTLFVFGAGTPQMLAAQHATQAYALSLLQVAPALSATQSALQKLHGQATGLQDVLVELGMSADDAAKAIQQGVTAALAQLATSFTTDLQRQLNSATGKDYINQILDAMASHASNLADAQSLGLDPALVNQVFVAQVQQIINGTDLIGASFDALIAQFPELAGQVMASQQALDAASKAAQDAADAQAKAAQDAADAMKKFTDSIKQFRDSLLTGDLSVLGPMDKLKAAQSQFDADVAKALTGDAEAQGRIQQEAQTLLTSARDVFASSAAYASVFNDTLSKLDQLSAMTPMASGGIVTGGIPGVDSVPALLMPGEVVLNTSQVSQMARFAAGGMVAGGIASSPFAANDNEATRRNFADLARSNMAGFQMLAERLDRLERAYLTGAKMQADETRNLRTSGKRPGRQDAA